MTPILPSKRRLVGEPTPSLPRDWTSTWLVLAVAAAMAFLAGLALAAAAGADSLARGWTADLARRATVSLTLDGVDAERDRETLAKAVAVVAASPGVAAARPLSSAEIDALLAPWMQDDLATADATRDARERLPLPALIDVALDGSAAAASAPSVIASRLAESKFVAEVDGHGGWIARLEPAATRIRALAAAGLAIIAAAAGAMVALACLTALAAQARVVDVLRLVGARDDYIAGLFVRRFRALAFVGSAIGSASAALALGLAAEPPPPVAELAPLAPRIAPGPWVWAQLALAPLGFALIATGAAWIATMVALRRREP